MPRERLAQWGVGEFPYEGGERRGRDIVVGEAAQERVTGADLGAGQGQVRAQFAGDECEQVRTADVRDESDAGLRHRDAGAFGDDTRVRMSRHPDASAHHEAVHQGDVRLGVTGDPSVEPVLVAPEGGCGGAVTGRHVVVDGADVAARAQAARTGPADDDGLDGVVVLPRGERRVDTADHVMGEGVESLRAVERDVCGASFDVQQDGFLGAGHRNASVSPRATMTRMISLVPSRIWWTRRSRTIFSTPYSFR